VSAPRLSFAIWAIVVALLFSACGGGSDTNPSTTVAAKPATRTTSPQAKKRTRKAPPAGELCQSQIGGFLGSIDSLRRRLAVGVTYDQYVDEVNGIRSNYRDVPVDKLRIDCVNAVGVPSEQALNRYIQAANDWGDCVSELGCGSAEVEPVLQQRWRAASHFLSEAQSGLRAVS
jgi:hypothetical protein